ncbi:MAG: prepilin-type N-terminal cleavage/methylation domain-containing protein [Akkermansia sp.]|nr:prepilin-type N-terminal cleavage/methylation domain-containing protein [Akkermansia sp.]
MKTTFTTHYKKGFTLIELLVVIAILATLAGISSPIIMGQMEAARESAARKTCMDIVEGATRFRTDYGQLPFRPDEAEANEANNYQVSLTTEVGSDAGMLAILTNREEDDDNRMNTNKDYYIRSDVQDKKADGLYEDPATGDLVGLYDPWGKPYYVLMCEENDGCTDPFTGKKLRGKNCIVYSLGSNGTGKAPDTIRKRKRSNNKNTEMTAAEEEAEEAIADNIYSWKKVSK